MEIWITYAKFKDRVDQEKDKLIHFFNNCIDEDKSVFGIGASTKGNVLLQYYNIDRKLLTKIGEVNKEKIGCFTPKTLIPIVAEDEILSLNPDYLVIFPWHFKDFFINNEKFKNFNLVFPLPFFNIVKPK